MFQKLNQNANIFTQADVFGMTSAKWRPFYSGPNVLTSHEIRPPPSLPSYIMQG